MSIDAYQNKSGVSGVVGYEIGSEFIKVIFQRSPCVYLYDYRRHGANNVEAMIQLEMIIEASAEDIAEGLASPIIAVSKIGRAVKMLAVEIKIKAFELC